VDALHGGETVAYTYAEMRDRVQKLTGTMQSLGVGPNDCVSVFAENSNRWLTTEQGIMRAGACNAVRCEGYTKCSCIAIVFNYAYFIMSMACAMQPSCALMVML
jgi:long-subunit acyl-CoA synthetase (AMP-forming)